MQDCREIAEDFASHLKAKYGLRAEQIILFGSVRRADYREDSDVDLLVVTPGDWCAFQEEIVEDVIDWLLTSGVHLSTMVFSAADFSKLGETGFGRIVADEGVALA